MTGTIAPIGVFTTRANPRDAGATPMLYDTTVDPGATNAPIIFEPPAPLTTQSTEVWLIATGADPSWGGAVVYISGDNVTYAPVGALYRGARQGRLTAPLPVGSDPDETSILSVDLGESRTQLLSATTEDADSLTTLCYVDGELISYRSAVLTSPFTYDVTYLRRGAYATPVISHSAGTKFARIGPHDASVFRYRYPPSFIGRTVWVKLLGFNIFGAGSRGLDEVTATTYVLTGAGLTGGTGYAPPVVTHVPPLPKRFVAPIEETDEGFPLRRR